MEEITSLLAQHGLLLVFANVLLTQAGIPVPAVPMLVVAGALAAQGEFGYTALLLTAPDAGEARLLAALDEVNLGALATRTPEGLDVKVVPCSGRATAKRSDDGDGRRRMLPTPMDCS